MTPDDYMAKGARALAFTKLLLIRGDLNGACIRAYYAMFNGAHAALLRSGAHVSPGETKTYRGLIAAVWQLLVKPESYSADLGRSFN